MHAFANCLCFQLGHLLFQTVRYLKKKKPKWNRLFPFCYTPCSRSVYLQENTQCLRHRLKSLPLASEQGIKHFTSSPCPNMSHYGDNQCSMLRDWKELHLLSPPPLCLTGGGVREEFQPSRVVKLYKGWHLTCPFELVWKGLCHSQ